MFVEVTRQARNIKQVYLQSAPSYATNVCLIECGPLRQNLNHACTPHHTLNPSFFEILRADVL